MEKLLQDLKLAFRLLTNSPAFTATAIIALSLGIGGNAAVFSVVNGVLLRPLPYRDPDRLVVLRETKLPQFPEFSIAPGNLTDWQKQSTVFERLAARQTAFFNLVGRGDPERLRGTRMSVDSLDLLGVSVALGRNFRPEEGQPGHEDVAILSHSFWQRHFGSDPGVPGQTLALNGRTYTVIGVMPPGFQYPDDRVELWVPLAFDAGDLANHGGHYLQAVGRLREGIPLKQAQAELSTIAGRLQQQYPRTNAGWDVRLAPMLDFMVRDLKPTLLVLQGTVVLVLLIACANIANLLLARGTGRTKEIAIRTALGASRARVIRQLLTESVLLAFIGAGVGLGLAAAGLKILLAIAPAGLPRMENAGIDGRSIAFTLGVAVLTALLFGLAPTLQVSGPHVADALKEGGRGSGAGEGSRYLRSGLVIAEVALALTLLVCSGLMLKSFFLLQRVDPGFEPKNALAASLSLPRAKYPDDQQRVPFFRNLIGRLESLPGVQSVGATHVLPFDSDYVLGFNIQGRPSARPGEFPTTNYYAVSEDYFKAMGIPLLRGRPFNEHDNKDAPRVAIINETMARLFFPQEDPIGKRINVTNGPETFREIVGIVGDVKQYGLDQPASAQTYEPYLQQPFSFMTLVLRSSTDPEGLVAAVRREVLGIDKEQPISSIQPVERLIYTSIAAQRFSMVLLLLFAAIALALAAVGVYGVMSYTVSQRSHEMGIRLALGAQARDVLKIVIGQGMILAVAGLAVGFASALSLTKLISSLLFQVQARDPATYVLVAVLLGVVSFLGCYIPALRATKVDPVEALRQE